VGSIEYPVSGCAGTLTLLSVNGNKFQLLEHFDNILCVSLPNFELSGTGDMLDALWSTSGISFTGSFTRREFDPLRDCPCIQAPGTVPAEQAIADASALAGNVSEAAEEIPRCGDLRRAFSDNYDADTIQTALDYYTQERRCTLNAVGIVREAATHASSVGGAFIDVDGGQIGLSVQSPIESFIGFYSAVRGLRDLTNQDAGAASSNRQFGFARIVERDFDAANLQDRRELLVEATVGLNDDEKDLLALGDQFADTFDIDGHQAFGVMTVTGFSSGDSVVHLTLHALVLTDTPPADTPTPIETPNPTETPTATAPPTETATQPADTPTPIETPNPTATPTETAPPTASATMTQTLTSTEPPPATGTPGPICAGDCDNGGAVTVDEIIGLVNIALGTGELSGCSSGDGDRNGQITVDEILTAVNRALEGCAPPI
jgi:hypothetical protein